MKLKTIFVHLVLFISFSGFLGAAEELYPLVKLNNPLDAYRKIPELNASGSAQFSENGFALLMRDLPAKDIIVVDIRRECHGFVNGYQVAWKLKEPLNCQSYEYNHGLNSEEIENKELAFLDALSAGTFQTPKGVTLLTPETISTERTLVEKMGAKYVRLTVFDHQWPSNVHVDQFIRLVRALPKDQWIHLHCAGGQGRTTTFLSMLHMMRKGTELSAHEIMLQQHEIGGSNLWDSEEVDAGKEPIVIERALARYHFLCLFHQYCSENPDFSKTWSEWVSAHQHPNPSE